MKITLLHDRILVFPQEPEAVTASGLHIPALAQKDSQEGLVVAVGPGKVSRKTGQRIPPGVQVGDHVLFLKQSGERVMFNEKEHRLMREDDLLAVI